MRSFAILFVVGAMALCACQSSGDDDSDDVGIDVVFVIVMENHADNQIYGNNAHAPYLNGTLLPLSAHATNYQDDLPLLPSEPHYVWMEAGTNTFSDWVFLGDGDPSSSNSTASTEHLTTQMQNAGVSWMAYQEDMDDTSGACPVKSHGRYAAKHDPFVFFNDVAGDPPSPTNEYCVAHHKPFSALATDLAAESIAAYNFITPNLCNDMHGASGCPSDKVLDGDSWLAEELPPILAYVNEHHGVVFIAWDEPETSGGMPLIALGPGVKQGYASDVEYSHSSLLKSLEEIFGLPTLNTVAGANDFADLFEAGSFP